MRYRRVFIPGAAYFFTVVTAQRYPWFANPDHVELLRSAFRAVRVKYPFTIEAMVVLPDHLHCIWTLPPGDADFATRWRLIKSWFSKRVPVAPTDVREGQRQRRVWQNRYWEHWLRDENDFRAHVEYIHFNPVKHGLAVSAGAWPYSSFGRYVAAGLYPADWGQSALPDLSGIGSE